MDEGRFSPDQAEAVERISAWFDAVRGNVTHCGSDDPAEADEAEDGCPKGAHTHSTDDIAPVFSLGGYAGTGKTSIVKWLEAKLAARVTYGTPTHKAARVLRGKLDAAQKLRVSTFYALVYTPDPKFVCESSGKKIQEITRPCVCGEVPEDCTCPRVFEPCGMHDMSECTVRQELNWLRREYMRGHTDLLVVDESSMLSEDQVGDIRKFGVPILLVGDHGQLPPVKAAMNPWIARPDVVLTENHRQRNDTSGIVDIALWAREGNQLRKGEWGDGRAVVMAHDDPRMGDLMDADRYLAAVRAGGQLPAIITANNRTRAGINMRFHGEGPPREGDRVVALKRCEVDVVEAIDQQGKPILSGDGDRRMVHNGHTGTIRAVTDVARATVNMVVELDDTNGTMVWVTAAALKQFGSPTVLGEHERSRTMRLWDYAYAMTCHKCVDDRTKILTKSGWKQHADLVAGESVLTLNPETRMSEWQPLQAVHRYGVVNENLLSIEAESHSSMTTLNHRWPVRGHQGKTVWRTSQHLLDRPSGYHAIFKSADHANFPREARYSDAFVELVAWFWTEGSISSNRGERIGSVKISQSITANPDKTESIRSALSSEFGPARELGRWTDKTVGWNESVRTMTQNSSHGNYSYPERTFDYATFTLNNAAGSLLQACAPDKVVTPEFILSLTREQLELFIHTSVLGDGTTTGGKYRSIRQASRERLEAFQFSCTLAGYSTVIRRSGETWAFRLKTGRILNIRPYNWRNSMTVVPYTGTVWCPQTANGTWFAKRNETTYFTGNSQGSEWDDVIVLNEAFADRARWLYTAVTRARKRLVVVEFPK